MNACPSISIVMALKDKESTVKRAIESILHQTTKDFELIVVDRSTDGGPNIVRSYHDERIRLVSDTGGSVGAARNQGIELALSDLVAFLDADDEYSPNFIEVALKMVGKYPDASAFYQMFEIVEKDGTKHVIDSCSEGKQNDGIVERYFHVVSEGGVPMTTSSAVIRRRLLLELGGFKRNVWYGEDTDLWGRIALNHCVVFDHNIGTTYHRDSPNRLSDKHDNPGEHVLIAELEKALSERTFGSQKVEDIMEYIVKLRFSSAYRSLLAGDARGARDILRRTKTRNYRIEKMTWLCWTILPNKLFQKFHR
jgi:glycosyltransferase involved in cell wall biosynthesis